MKTYSTVSNVDTLDSLYSDIISFILRKGEDVADRTRCFFNDNKLMVPVFKPVNIKAVAAELYCFINGIKGFGCNWWEGNLQDANKRWGTPDNRDLGPVYGVQWIKPFYKNGVLTNQLKDVIETLKVKPTDRRAYITAWNPQEMDAMALPPCYHGFQLFINNRNELELMFHMRSADVILGLPHDILLHQMLQITIAAELGVGVGDMTVTLGDYHIYQNHIDAAKIFLQRIVSNSDTTLDTNFFGTAAGRPDINAIYDVSVFDFTPADVAPMVEKYKPMPNIKLQMAV
ncbi:thymidylate synthase [Salmonella phage SPHG1]|nr:thymidylate synthase [Salmonella phage SPHG1]